MGILEILSAVLLVTGGLFFFAGTLGMLRFPDVYSRLHALTKVDNLGLGLVVLGLMITAGSLAVVLKLALIWLLSVGASATAGYLVAGSARRNGIVPWRREAGR